MVQHSINNESKKALRVCFIIVFCLFISACAGSDEEFLNSSSGNTSTSILQQTHDDFSVDLSGFESPDIPENLQDKAQNQVVVHENFAYTVEFSIIEREDILPFIETESVLLNLISDIPTNRIILDRRITEDKAAIEELLHNFGYYSAVVDVHINDSSDPIAISIHVVPGRPFLITSTDILYSEKYTDPLVGQFNHLDEKAPNNLFELGLGYNSVAETEEIISTSLEIATWFKERGFPYAKPIDSEYSVYQDTFSFEAKIDFEPGDYVRLGDVIVQGSEALDFDFINKIKTWEYGDPWSDTAIHNFEQDLLAFGIFSFVDSQPSDVINDGITDVTLTLADGPSRTWGGGINYDITRQFGLQLFWEHRNLFNEAEKFRVNTNLWLDTQEISFDYLLPDITKKNHNLDFEVLFKREVTDAIEVNSATADVTYEFVHRFANQDIFTNAYTVRTEIGEDYGNELVSRESYSYIGLPIEFLYEHDIDLFRPTNGYSLDLEVAPYYGEYFREFNIIRSEASVVKYFEILDRARLVLALRAKGGYINHTTTNELPPSLRFYLGGGNSIRGYAYQSIGPKDSYGDPVGGSSYLEGTGEMRIRISDNITLVPFYDLGNLVEEIEFSDITFKHSAGLGFQFLTPIGPFRIDGAIPLFDDEKEIKDFQIYVSIGQSF